MGVFYSLNLRANVRQNLVKLGVVVVGFRPFNTSITYNHVTLAFARVVITDFNWRMLEFTAASV
jgi:hypothetical protein